MGYSLCRKTHFSIKQYEQDLYIATYQNYFYNTHHLNFENPLELCK